MIIRASTHVSPGWKSRRHYGLCPGTTEATFSFLAVHIWKATYGLCRSIESRTRSRYVKPSHAPSLINGRDIEEDAMGIRTRERIRCPSVRLDPRRWDMTDANSRHKVLYVGYLAEDMSNATSSPQKQSTSRYRGQIATRTRPPIPQRSPAVFEHQFDSVMSFVHLFPSLSITLMTAKRSAQSCRLSVTQPQVDYNNRIKRFPKHTGPGTLDQHHDQDRSQMVNLDNTFLYPGSSTR